MLTSNDLSNLPTYLTYDDVLLLPNYSEVKPAEVDISTMVGSIQLRLPVISSPMDTVTEELMAQKIAELGGLGIIHRNLPIEAQAAMVDRIAQANLPVAGAVGVGEDFERRVKALVNAGAIAICIDTAHGHTKHIIEATRYIRENYHNIVLISGNVATYEGAKALFDVGADVLRVGMGPGSICTTRVMSGMGVPQLTAVVECARAAKEAGKHIIADGGLRTSGDIVKGLAAGASSVMMGSLLAGTDEAPGEVIELQGQLYKSYRGMGSVGAMKDGSAARYGQKYEPGKTKNLVAEGVEGLVKHKGHLEDHLHQLMGGLRAGMGYLGAANLTELEEKAKFIKISSASLIESKPHSILMN